MKGKIQVTTRPRDMSPESKEKEKNHIYPFASLWQLALLIRRAHREKRGPIHIFFE